MIDRDRIVKLVHGVIDELNELLPEGEALRKEPGTVILGEGGGLDSMGTVNLVVALDNRLQETLGRPVNLTEDPRIFEKGGVLSTVGTMTDFLLAAARAAELSE
jgi:hypothetical protein